MHGLELSETRECSADVRHGARATEMPENESAAQWKCCGVWKMREKRRMFEEMLVLHVILS